MKLILNATLVTIIGLGIGNANALTIDEVKIQNPETYYTYMSRPAPKILFVCQKQAMNYVRGEPVIQNELYGPPKFGFNASGNAVMSKMIDKWNSYCAEQGLTISLIDYKHY